MVRHHEDAVAQHCHSAVLADGRVARGYLSLSPGTGIVPELAASGGVQGVGLIDCGHVHHAVHYHRSDLEWRGIRNREEPPHAKACDVPPMDLVQGAMPVAAQLPVIRRPLARPGVYDVGERDPGRRRPRGLQGPGSFRRGETG